MRYASTELEISTAFYFSRKSQARYKGPTDRRTLWYLRPMTHDPKTGAINRLYFSGADFWYVCRANLDPDSSGSRFRRRL